MADNMAGGQAFASQEDTDPLVLGGCLGVAIFDGATEIVGGATGGFARQGAEANALGIRFRRPAVLKAIGTVDLEEEYEGRWLGIKSAGALSPPSCQARQKRVVSLEVRESIVHGHIS